MNVLSGVLLFAAAMVLVPVSIRVAIALSRRGSWGKACSVLSLAFVPLALLLGALWLSRQGRPETGIVVGKTDILEVSSIGLNPSVAHRLVLSVASGVGSMPAASLNPHAVLFERLRRPRADLEFDVGEQLYDDLRQDSIVHFHTSRLGPLVFARLDAEPWWNLAPGRLERLLPAHSSGPFLTARATIVASRTVVEAYETSLLAGSGEGGSRTVLRQPYDEVRFQFSTAQGADITALDRIDAGSAGSLTPGMTVAVRYPLDRPRQALLTLGTRRFARINAESYWSSDILGFAAAVVVSVVALRAWKRWRVIAGTPRIP